MSFITFGRLSILTAMLLGLAGPALAQTTEPGTRRVAVSIDYVSTDGLYLGVGSDGGAAVGDTIPVFADSIAGEALGRIVLLSVTRRRSVARPLEATSLEAGRTVFLEIPVVAGAPSTSVVAAAPTPVVPRSAAPSADAGARLTGRSSFDLAVRETRTSWSGDLSGESVRRFATPTTRLSLVASNLPGGLMIRANVRAAYRYDEITAGPPPLSVRAYELAVSRELDAVPVQILLGRFANPYESYSAYWDGVAIRVGFEAGPGIGVVAGFEPHLQDEGFSTTLPKLTAFADYAVRAGAWRYDTDVSLHFMRPGSTLDLAFAGWSQRASLGPLDLSQRLRLHQGDDRRWSVADARMRAVLRVAEPFRLRASYGRLSTAIPLGVPTADTLMITPAPMREEASAGIELGGPRGGVWADVGGTRREGWGRGISLSTGVRWAWRSSRVGLGAQRWSGGGTRTLSAAPTFEMIRGSLSWRTSYRLYRADTAFGSTVTHTVGSEVGFALARKLHLTVGGERQWGERLTGTRLHLGVWRAF
jgi:hypothetical protein